MTRRLQEIFSAPSMTILHESIGRKHHKSVNSIRNLGENFFRSALISFTYDPGPALWKNHALVQRNLKIKNWGTAKAMRAATDVGFSNLFHGISYSVAPPD
ncbi:hypothetical protein TWF173_009619 [Orbilia oligospora]|uniref:Uncharacterized protein n=1 Tax=Orbilia oligospora TaxID=2813651 RepID=A0A7C8VCY6_ORBOL|nr:hypothetical protein TWF970_005120 [Orbilia oligospora]KAF3317797.1 hypothetical protein TWF173_009619 [Orbilia oligospora]